MEKILNENDGIFPQHLAEFTLYVGCAIPLQNIVTTSRLYPDAIYYLTYCFGQSIYR